MVAVKMFFYWLGTMTIIKLIFSATVHGINSIFYHNHKESQEKIMTTKSHPFADPTAADALALQLGQTLDRKLVDSQTLVALEAMLLQLHSRMQQFRILCRNYRLDDEPRLRELLVYFEKCRTFLRKLGITDQLHKRK